jgi:hypothetical protein
MNSSADTIRDLNQGISFAASNGNRNNLTSTLN